MKLIRRGWSPNLGLAVNMAYAAGNCCLGFAARSWWFITVGAYYALLSVARFCVLRCVCREQADMEIFARKTGGVMLIGMAICLTGVNILTAVQEQGRGFHKIIMIAMAAYAFAKLTMAIWAMAGAGKGVARLARILRNISFADAIVSIYSLQRSMLASFPGMSGGDIRLFNILTGTAATVIVLLLGINLLVGRDSSKASTGPFRDCCHFLEKNDEL